MKYVLIVDDDKDLTETLKMRLEVEDFEVGVVHDGEEAIKKVNEKAPDLIIMDVLMPRLDGLGTIQKINQLREQKIPFIIMTGTAVMMEETFRIEGARVFFKKPFDGSKMVKYAKEILNA